MVTTVGVRAWQSKRVGEYGRYYPAVSALIMLLIGGVTASNATVICSYPTLLVGVGEGVVILNGLGYCVGFLLSHLGDRPTRIASVLSVGVRDFAAAALVIAAGLLTIASLPAVVFGVVEMTTSAGPAKWFQRAD